MDAVNEFHTKARTFARFGYAARAVVYFVMGGLALLVAFGHSDGAATDSKGTMRELLGHPFGNITLVVLALGLFCYASWRLSQAILDANHEGKSAKGLVTRGGFVLGALAHYSLGLYTLNLVFYFSSKTSGGSEQTLAHQLLVLPFGRVITSLVGLGIIGFGLSQFVVAWKEKFARKMDIPAQKRRLVMPICKFGLIARGFVFGMIGVFFTQAAIKYSSQEAGGITRAWSVLHRQPFGDFLIAIVAIGFMAFGVYGMTEALYSRTRTT